ncbi:MAG: ParA family protein [Planctomycetota bacterium]|nr:ParA family protein [Planctomycetota bacterium]MCZ6690034.1 ParA family protein [Planctomycetota bacterium]
MRRSNNNYFRKQLFLSFKGGTGKTSLSASYGARLASLGKRVLLLDVDPQAHLTKCLGQDGTEVEKTLYDVLIYDDDLRSAVVPTSQPNLSLVPSNLSLSATELSLAQRSLRESRLKYALNMVRNDYDVVIMDAAPTIGLLNLNSILAADDIIIPVLPDFLSYHGLKILFETLASIEKEFLASFQSIYIIINRFIGSEEVCLAARKALERYYSDYLMKTVVRDCPAFSEASVRGISIFDYDPKSQAAKDLTEMIEEMFGSREGRYE